MDKLRQHNELEKNPVGLADDVVRQIIPELDRHVSSLFVLFHQYQKHHWMVEGPQFRDLHLYLEESYNQIHTDLDAVAERITLLGGVPTSHPGEQVKLSYVAHEEDGVYPIRKALGNDMEAEAAVATKVRHTIKLADDLGDYGSKRLLEMVLENAEERAHHMEHYLGKDSLVKAGEGVAKG